MEEELVVSRFSEEVERALQAVLPSTDPLDQPDFDPVAYLNDRFPDEASLGSLDEFSARLRKHIVKLDDGIRSAVQEQSTAGKHASDEIAQAREAIGELFGKIKDIRGKAQQSEELVEKICADIMQLDNAKRHLTTTCSTLRKLQMLVTAVDQLRGTGEERQYREAARLLGAVNELSTVFRDYRDVPRIAELHDQSEELKGWLTNRILDDFARMGELESEAELEDLITEETLHDACLAVEALGPEVQRSLVDLFCEGQIAPYRRLFARGSEYVGLEHVERRFAWFRRILRAYRERYESVFPRYWRIDHTLAIKFCQVTAEMLQSQLDDIDAPEDEDVTALLRALQATQQFEREMYNLFEAPWERMMEAQQRRREREERRKEQAVAVMHMDASGNFVQMAEGDEERGNGDAETAGEGSEGGEGDAGRRRGAAAAGELEPPEGYQVAELPTFKCIMSPAFEPYLTGYVRLEKSKMLEMLDGVMEEERVDKDGTLAVLSSSLDLFLGMKNASSRCLPLSNGQTFFLLYKGFKEMLKEYSNRLLSKLPKPTGAGGAELYKLGDRDAVEYACNVVNTCVYCAQTIPQLEGMVKAKIAAAFQSHVDMENEVELFGEVLMTAIKVLASGLCNRLDGPLTAMTKMPWSTFADVGDQSAYVTQMADQMAAFVPTVRQTLNSLYFRMFLDKFVTTFLPRYNAALGRCRRVSEMGAQQLLLDAHAVKTLLTRAPNVQHGEEDEAAAEAAELAKPSPAYGKIVAREIKRAEVLLKLVATDEERLAESFKILWQEGTQEDFTLVLQMKGLKRKNQQELLSKVGPLQSAPPTAGSGAAAAGGGFGTADFSQSVRGTLDSSAAIFTKMFRKK